MKSDDFAFFDVHAHLHDHRIIKDAKGIMARAANAGVRFVATCATTADNFDATALLAKEFQGVIPCFGIHPWFLDTLSPGWQQHLGERLSESLACVGETGLDFMDKEADRDLQTAVFKDHLALARDLNRPVNIHIRKAWDAAVHIFKEMGPFPAGGLIHSYSGSAETARGLLSHNFYISFSGSVTRPNARKAVQALSALPPDRVLFETDAPDLFPSLDAAGEGVPLNEPGLVPEIVRIAARRTGISFEKLARRGYTNALELFDPVIPRQPLT